MIIRIDPTSDVLLFQQVAAGIRQQIAVGALLPGARLPSARVLAEQLDVNLHTVLKGYQMLRDEELIELRRGRGAVVAAKAEALTDLTALSSDLLEKARAAGVEVEGVISLLRGLDDA